MAQFDHEGNIRRKIASASIPGVTPFFQPVSLALNKQVTFKCSHVRINHVHLWINVNILFSVVVVVVVVVVFQESTKLLLSFPHDHIKITISSKLNMVS